MFARSKSIFLLILIFTVFQSYCGKKTPTTPQVETHIHPVIWVNTFELTFAASQSGSNPPSQVLQIKNSGAQTLNYTISDDADWATCDPTNGSSSGNVVEHTVSVNKSGLDAKEYTATISVTCSEACNSPQKVQVNLKITKEPPPEIWVNTNHLTFSAQEGGSNPPLQTIKIKNSGKRTLNYQITSDVSWLTTFPGNGSSAGAEKSHNVKVNISGLGEGKYNGKLTISDLNASNSPKEISVDLNITKEPPPEIWVSTHNISFQATNGGANPSSSISIMNSGGGTLNYSIIWDTSWLQVNPNSGSSQGAKRSHTVAVDIGGLDTGTYSGTITITDPKAVNSPQQINVTLQIARPLTDNKISISCNPISGGTDTVVTFVVSIKGNTKEIKSFGFKINYDSTMFAFVNAGKGDLTGNWGVDGQETGTGVAKIGGYAGGSNPIPTGSQGSIAIIKLKVTCSGCNDGKQSTICIDSFADDIIGMTKAPGCATFTFKK